MPSILATTREIVEITGIPRSALVAFMAKRGVRPIDFGRGRGLGLRWVREQAINAVFREPPSVKGGTRHGGKS